MKIPLAELPPERAAIAQCLLIAYRRGLQLQSDPPPRSATPKPSESPVPMSVAFDKLPKLQMIAVSQNQ